MLGLVIVAAILATLFRIVLILRGLFSQWDLYLSVLSHSFWLYLLRVCIRMLGRDLSMVKGVKEVIYLRFKYLLVLSMHF